MAPDEWICSNLEETMSRGRRDFCTPEVKGQFYWLHLYCWGFLAALPRAGHRQK